MATIQSADPTRLLLTAEGETVGASLKWAVKELYGLEPGGEAYATMDARVDRAAARQRQPDLYPVAVRGALPGAG